MGLYFSRMTNGKEFSLSQSLSLQVSILNRKLLITTKLSASAWIQAWALAPDGSF